MANLKVSWVLPTTRESGKPLAVTDIGNVLISVSADGGVSYMPFGQYTPDILSTVITELEPGEWFVKGEVSDKSVPVRIAKPKVASYTIPDGTPPSALLELTLSL